MVEILFLFCGSLSLVFISLPPSKIKIMNFNLTVYKVFVAFEGKLLISLG